MVAGMLAVGAAPAAAQGQAAADSAQSDSTVYSIDELVVQATRPTSTPGGASALEIRMDSMSVDPVPTLADVLRATPLVQVRQNSRGQAHLALRGAQERQIAVLVDGVPVTLGWDHRKDLSIVPMMAAQDIRLARGLPSMLHGPNVLGGVVEVNVARGTAPPEDPEAFQAKMSADHLGSYGLGATGAHSVEVGRRGRLIVREGAGYRGRPGFRAPSGSADSGLRTNSDIEQFDGFLALRYHSDEGRWLSFSASGFRAERGVPPEEHEADPRLWRYPNAARLFSAVSGGTGQVETPLGSGDLEASLGLELGRTEIDAYRTRDYREVVGGETGRDRTVTLRLLGDHTIGDTGELSAAATIADVYHDEVLRPRLGERYENAYQQRLWSVGGEVAWRFATLPLTGGALHGARVSGGLALDGAFTPRTGGHTERAPITAVGGRFGISALAGEDVQLHAGFSRRARFPSLRELYSAALGKFLPNPELGPERLLATEAGITTHIGPAEVQVAGFHHRLTDAIVRRVSPDPAYKYQRLNRDEMRSAGIELLGTWGWRDVALSADLTLQRVRVLDPDAPESARQAEYQPMIAGGADVRVPLPLDVRGTVSVDHMGRQWCVHPGGADAGMALDPSTRVDLALDRSFRAGWAGPLSGVDATLSVNNVTDAAIYDQCGLPQPGRTLQLQLQVR